MQSSVFHLKGGFGSAEGPAVARPQGATATAGALGPKALMTASRALVVLVLMALGCISLATLSAGHAVGDVGELGPPPSEPEIRQVLTGFYHGGQAIDSTVDVQFDGPLLVGPPVPHANPPPAPWCVRCGYPDQGISPMYPVMVLVRVTVSQALDSSALGPGRLPGVTTSHNGATCAGVAQAQYCPAYYFYRDTFGNWRVA